MSNRRASMGPGPIVIIERKALLRDCLARCIGDALYVPVLTFPDLESWSRALIDAVLIIVSGGNEALDSCKCVTMPSREHMEGSVPVVILSDCEDRDCISNFLRCGARGYIPYDTPLRVVVEAIRLILAGGLFVPPQIVLPESPNSTERDAIDRDEKDIFTLRERAVIDALKKGQANKAIAFDLRLSESSVKTHIHNVMKKLNARNRTEAVVKLSEFEIS